jgi:Uma2 family endonuclease
MARCLRPSRTRLVRKANHQDNDSRSHQYGKASLTLAALPSTTIETVADLLESLGDIPPERIRMRPFPGSATEDDVLAVRASERRLCELVDGVLVEKPTGNDESRLAAELIFALIEFLRRNNLGTAAGADGMMRLLPGLVRIPDVSFVRWESLPKSYGAIPPIAPDLAVEVLSESNTPREMERKLREYFEAGTGLVWYVDPRSRTVTVYTAPDQFIVLDESQTLDGGTILPGLEIPLRELFDRAGRRSGASE